MVVTLSFLYSRVHIPRFCNSYAYFRISPPAENIGRILISPPHSACFKPAKSLTITGAEFNRLFQSLHRELNAGDVRGWTSHAMRRGMALDVLEEHGFRAMLRAGDWNSSGAFAYASREHVEQRLVGQMFANFSDDDR